MSIRIGGSCGGRYSRPIYGITSYENRVLVNDEHPYFYQDSKWCIDNGVFLIVNIDTYKTDGRWHPTNPELRSHVLKVKDTLLTYGANRNNCRFTTDNEADEFDTVYGYLNKIRVIHDALNGTFDLGAGNFRTTSRDWYQVICSARYDGTVDFEVLDFHLQDGMTDGNKINEFTNWIKILCNTFNIKRYSCTEGNNFWNVDTSYGHSLIKTSIDYCESIGAEDFCFVYANWMENDSEDDDSMSYNIDNVAGTYWSDLRNYIALKKPITEEEDLKLEKFYYKDKVTFLRDVRKVGVKFIQSVLNIKVDGDFGPTTKSSVIAYQKLNELTPDGIVGPATFEHMMKYAPKIYDLMYYNVAIGEW